MSTAIRHRTSRSRRQIVASQTVIVAAGIATVTASKALTDAGLLEEHPLPGSDSTAPEPGKEAA